MIEKLYRLSVDLSENDVRGLFTLLDWAANCTADIQCVEIKHTDPDDDGQVEMFQHLCKLIDSISPEMVEIAERIKNDIYRAKFL